MINVVIGSVPTV